MNVSSTGAEGEVTLGMEAVVGHKWQTDGDENMFHWSEF